MDGDLPSLGIYDNSVDSSSVDDSVHPIALAVYWPHMDIQDLDIWYTTSNDDNVLDSDDALCISLLDGSIPPLLVNRNAVVLCDSKGIDQYDGTISPDDRLHTVLPGPLLDQIDNPTPLFPSTLPNTGDDNIVQDQLTDLLDDNSPNVTVTQCTIKGYLDILLTNSDTHHSSYSPYSYYIPKLFQEVLMGTALARTNV